MQEAVISNSFTKKLRILSCIVLFEYLLFIFSGVSFLFLHGDPFFSLEADPASWLVYLFRIPQLITAHQWIGILLDAIVVALLLIFIKNPFKNRVALALLILLFVFYVTLMGHLTHHNYQSGFFLFFIPFIFRESSNRSYAYEGLRYFLLFFYVSAALLKLFNHALDDNGHFSNLISGQFSPYFVEGNTGWRTNLNLYLISHPKVSYALYIGSFFIELATMIGFFTKRFDKWIAIIILLFHFGNWVIMDIAPFGQIAFICLLFISREMSIKKGS